MANTRKLQKKRIRNSTWLLLLGIVALLGLARLWSPLITLRQQADRLAELRLTSAELAAEKALLENRQHFLATERGQEVIARRMGYVRPGERRIVFFEEEKEQADETEDEGK